MCRGNQNAYKGNWSSSSTCPHWAIIPYISYCVMFDNPHFGLTLWADKASMLIHTYKYPLKILRKIKVTMQSTGWQPTFVCGLMSDLLIYKFRKVWSYLTPNVPGVIKQPKPKLWALFVTCHLGIAYIKVSFEICILYIVSFDAQGYKGYCFNF